MATVNIGNIKFNWKGAWDSSTTYAVDDVVSHSGSSYVSIQAGSNQNPASASSYWEQMSSAGTNGTNGTDLTSTLTTQGDIVYRDGSGLARLGYGTAGQVLQTNGSGQNPSWATVSSDFVKTGTVETTSDVASVDLQNCFSTTYDFYIVRFGMLNGSGNYWFEPIWLKADGTTDTTNMVHKHYEIYGNASTHSNGFGGQSDTSGWRIMNTWYQNDNTYFANGVIHVTDPMLTHQPRHMWYDEMTWAYGNGGASHIGSDMGMGYMNSSSAHTGIRFRMNGGNIQTGFRATVYGLKN
tara:strand:+ start:231 stop:1115 length:885 start_codon:yes stop_codon:yes gene_type:complete